MTTAALKAAFLADFLVLALVPRCREGMAVGLAFPWEAWPAPLWAARWMAVDQPPILHWPGLMLIALG